MSSKLERVFTIDALIRAGRYPNARTMAQRFEVTRGRVLKDGYLLERPLEYSRFQIDRPVVGY